MHKLKSRQCEEKSRDFREHVDWITRFSDDVP